MRETVRGSVAALVAVVLTAAMLVLVPQSAQAARSTLTASRTAPIQYEKFTFTYRMKTSIPRKVWLQRKQGSKWVTLSKKKSSKSGKGTFGFATVARTSLFRVHAPKTKYKKKKYGATSTPRRSIRTVAQSGKVQISLSADPRKVTAKSSFLPRRPGRIVYLQKATKSRTWVTTHRGKETSSGTTTFDRFASVDAADGGKFRAVAAHRSGARAYGSPPVTFAAARSVIVKAPNLGVTDEAGDVSLVAETTGSVSKVRFFVDGKSVGEDSAAPWSVNWSPKSGTHDLVARAFGPDGSVLSRSVQMAKPSSPVVDETSGLPPGFELKNLASGFELPTSFAIADIGTIFVAEKAGVVKMFGRSDSGDYSQPRQVLDIRNKVLDQQDRGLIGIATDPEFHNNGYIYLSYVFDDGSGNTADDERVNQIQRVERYTVVDGVADPSTAHVVLGAVEGSACYDEGNLETPDCVPIHGFSHSIGDLAFDQDDRLLVGIGDGALFYANGGLEGRMQSLRAQNPEILAGKVLRIDKSTGKGIRGNPFYTGDGSSNASRVLALGFRNPFRLTVRDNGAIVVGEVGESAFEEINVIKPGGNYGWPCFEGDEETAVTWPECETIRGATGAAAAYKPIHSYAHSGGGSISGGVFYTGQAYPEEFRGRYFFGDYAQNFIRTAAIDSDGDIDGPVDDFSYKSAAGGPVKFAMAPDDTIWYLSIYSGELRQIHYSNVANEVACADGKYRASYFDIGGPDAPINGTYEPGWEWLRFASATFPAEALGRRCVDNIQLDPTTQSVWPEKNVPTSDFGIQWQGKIQSTGGTYEFTIHGKDWVRLSINDKSLYEWFAYGGWTNDGADKKRIRLPAGTHNVRVDLVHEGGEASTNVTWERVGSPPTVVLSAPANGTRIAPGGSVAYSLTASDSEDAGVDGSRVKVVADLMHYDGNAYHFHPVADRTGASGTFTFSDDHAPNHSVFRLTGRVTDASGEEGVSAPVYVCLVGNEVGPCALK